MLIWDKIYEALQAKNCKQLKVLFSNLSAKDRKSPYFLKYWQQYRKICPEKLKKNKLYYKGKVLKCPYCGANIIADEYNKIQIEKLRKGEQQVIFVCSYCGSKFFYSKKTFKSIFKNYSVGQEITINGKKLIIAGGVKYEGFYQEGDEKGNLIYIEWTCYNDKGDLYYVSESRAEDYYGLYYESEVSEKVDFSFLPEGVKNNNLITDKGNEKIDEYDEVKVISVIGDLNKSYRIGEKVKLWKFGDYTLEEETNGNYIERNLYKNIKSSISNGMDGIVNGNEVFNAIIINFVYGFFLLLLSLKCLILFAGLSLFFFILLLFFNKKKLSEAVQYIMVVGIVLLILCFLSFNNGFNNGEFSSGGHYSSSSYWGTSSYGGGK